MSLTMDEDSCTLVHANTHTHWHKTFGHVKRHTRLHAVTRTPLTYLNSAPCRSQTAHTRARTRTRAHTLPHRRSLPPRSDKCSQERRRTLWCPPFSSVLRSGGGGRGRRRGSRSRLRSCRSRRSVGTGTSEARGGAAAVVSSRRGETGAAPRPASAPRTAPTARGQEATRTQDIPRRPKARVSPPLLQTS